MSFNRADPVTQQEQISLGRLQDLADLARVAASPYTQGPGYWSAVGSIATANSLDTIDEQLPAGDSASIEAINSIYEITGVAYPMDPLVVDSLSGLRLESPGPLLPPINISAVPTSGGSIADGTVYYVLTSTNSNGESVASAEISCTMAGPLSSATLTWTHRQGATGYNLYRSTVSGVYGPSSLVMSRSVAALTAFQLIVEKLQWVDGLASQTAGAPPTTGTATTGPVLWVQPVEYIFSNSQQTSIFPNIANRPYPTIVFDGTHGLTGVYNPGLGDYLTVGILAASSTVYPDGTGTQIVIPGVVTGASQQWSGNKDFLGTARFWQTTTWISPFTPASPGTATANFVVASGGFWPGLTGTTAIFRIGDGGGGVPTNSGALYFDTHTHTMGISSGNGLYSYDSVYGWNQCLTTIFPMGNTGYLKFSNGFLIETMGGPGTILLSAGQAPFVVPFGRWLLCDGSSYSTVAFPGLFTAIGYTYGGSGASFKVPNISIPSAGGPAIGAWIQYQ